MKIKVRYKYFFNHLLILLLLLTHFFEGLKRYKCDDSFLFFFSKKKNLKLTCSQPVDLKSTSKKKNHYFVSDRLYFYGSPKGTPILSEKLPEAMNLKKSISGGLKLNSFKNCYLSLELSSKSDLFS